ncbi:YopX family protein [Patescibacteria group bacterium]
MNRRFEFRVWHKEKEYMYRNVAIGVGKSKIGYRLSGKKRYVWEEEGNIVVNQYTGYNDSKGEPIFDGDILKFGANGGYLATVLWDDYKFTFKIKGESTYTDKFGHWGRVSNVKVIGNIYENPELLE